MKDDETAFRKQGEEYKVFFSSLNLIDLNTYNTI